MSKTRTIAVFIGSLRKESFSRKVAQAMGELAPSGVTLETIPIGELPFYNQDTEKSPPSQWLSFREQVKRTDALLFVTPEYNRSVPGVLKNAVDVGSRPYGQSVFSGKPGAVVSVTPGGLGAFGANHHLRQSLVFLDVVTLAQPEAYLANVAPMFNEAGALTNDATREFLRKYMTAFTAFIEQQLK